MTTELASPPPKPPGANEPCWCGSGAKYKKCHRDSDDSDRTAQRQVINRLRSNPVRPGEIGPAQVVPPHIVRPDYAETGEPGPGVAGDPATQLSRLRAACRAAAEVLRETGEAVGLGVTTEALDVVCHNACIARGGYPSPLGYRNFPKSLCTSVNEVICHGIPDSRPLANGDIVNCDVTIYLDGMHGDCSATFGVGQVDAASLKLMQVTRECLAIGIEKVKPGRPGRDIGRAIEAHAERYGYGVVRAYCGHGVGPVFHQDPQVPHYFDPDCKWVMEEGMVFTIEPMISMGTWRHTDWPDGWTVATADGLRSAQYEHTLRVGRDGAEILTLAP